MTLNWLDWLIIGIYCVLVTSVGFLFKKRADKGTEDYFVSGRKLHWWVAGTAMAASAWASDTPLLVTGYIREHGIWFNWTWWSLAVSSMLAVFFFSRLWRRARVVTEVELVELRYSGREAAFLRGLKAIYFGVLFNCYAAGAWPVKGFSKVIDVALGLETPWHSIAICVTVGLVYSSAAGMWGIVVADLVEMVFMIGGALVLTFWALGQPEVGGLAGLTEKLGASEKLRMFPAPSSDVLGSPFWWVVGMLLIQWWAWKNTDGGGMVIQKMAACRNERHAVYATLWYNIVHNALRVWPWAIVAVASLILIPEGDARLVPGEPAKAKVVVRAKTPGDLAAGLKADDIVSVDGSFAAGEPVEIVTQDKKVLARGPSRASDSEASRYKGPDGSGIVVAKGEMRVADPERAYPLMFKTLLPNGLLGLVVASFFAAFMSSVSAMTNWGASYVVNDFYKRFVRPHADEKHYVFASRVATILIMLGTIISALLTQSIGKAFIYVLQFTAGVGVVFLARWFWWRVNAWSEIAALIASIPTFIAMQQLPALLAKYDVKLHPQYSAPFNLLFMVVGTALVWIPVTLFTKPADTSRLIEFYRRVQPPGFWGPIATAAGGQRTERLGIVLVLWLVGIAFIYSATFGLGQLLLGDRQLGMGLSAVAAIAFGFIAWKVRDLPTPDSPK